MKLQSVMMDLEGYELQDVEREMLAHPLIGGLILFSRNFYDSKQLIHLIKEARTAAKKPIIVSVDHEGGRVQRFRSDKFSHLPAMGELYPFFAHLGDEDNLSQGVQDLAWLMAAECMAHNIDISFSPVLDLERGSDVIGDRAFHSDINITTTLATNWCLGMKQAGMARIGKHFPGHGSVKEDSHIAAPIDERNYETIEQQDMQVFSRLINKRLLEGVMPAHIRFPQIDSNPVGYSKVWLNDILKSKLGFNGLIFSDDLSMEGAGKNLTYTERAIKALSAGCDLILLCNQPNQTQAVLDQLPFNNLTQRTKVEQLIANNYPSFSSVKSDLRWKNATSIINKIKK